MGYSMPGFPVLHHFPDLLKLMSLKSMMLYNHLITLLLLLPSIFSSIRVFSNESALRIRWKSQTFILGCACENHYRAYVKTPKWERERVETHRDGDRVECGAKTWKESGGPFLEPAGPAVGPLNCLWNVLSMIYREISPRCCPSLFMVIWIIFSL